VTPESLAALVNKWSARRDANIVRHASATQRAGGPVAAFDEAPLVDSLLGDRALARDIARTFVADIPRRVQALQLCLDADDAKGVAHQAHTIKGAAAAMTCAVLVSLATLLETAGKSGDLKSARTSFENLREELDWVLKAMEASPLLASPAS
jgi:HPt (histidine-containing phosphotransfer) domain-containing protein